MKTQTTKCILYARFSPRPGASQCESIAKQLRRLRSWCSLYGYEIVAEYEDAAVSGSTTDDRPGLEKAIMAACRLHAVLVSTALSRIARCTKDAIEIAERLQTYRGDLATLDERIDTSSATGRFFFAVMAALAQLEREQISERTSEAMLRHQANGRRMGRADRVPFGLRVPESDPNGLVTDEDERATIDRIVELKTAGASQRAICEALDKEGRDRRGKTWLGAHRLVGTILRRAGA